MASTRKCSGTPGGGSGKSVHTKKTVILHRARITGFWFWQDDCQTGVGRLPLLGKQDIGGHFMNVGLSAESQGDIQFVTDNLQDSGDGFFTIRSHAIQK